MVVPQIDPFDRQRAMFHVLHSFSLYCATCGYCQGMGPLAATLLCYFEPEVCSSSSLPLLSCPPALHNWIKLLNWRRRKSTRVLCAFTTHLRCTTSSRLVFPGY